MNNKKEIIGKIIYESLVFGSFVGALIFSIIIILGFVSGADDSIVKAAVIFFALNVSTVAVCKLLKEKKSRHTYDSGIIGDNFVSLSKKDRLFRDSVQQLMERQPVVAVEGFKALQKDYSADMTEKEKALVCFYSARCYDTMSYFPNALKYYDDAERLGFSDGIMEIFRARCYAGMGELDVAVKKYKAILADKNNIFRSFVRTDVGGFYLERNEAEKALVWFEEAIDKRENYAEALGGAAIAHTMLRNFKKGEELCRTAMVNKINNPMEFLQRFKSVQASVMVESHTDEAVRAHSDGNMEIA